MTLNIPISNDTLSIKSSALALSDLVFQTGHGTIYKSDGRTRTNPEINYGTDGLLQGKQYLITTSWNAPTGAFTLKDEFMEQTSPDDGVLFGFHKAMRFVGLSALKSFHFYDVAKGLTPEKLKTYNESYSSHLKQIFEPLKKQSISKKKSTIPV